MTANASRFLQRLATFATAFAIALGLTSCGSGAVTDNTGSGNTSAPISITPSSATLFSDLPTTFVLSGGNGSYVVTSNNQAVIPLGATRAGNQLVVVPNAVAVDTPVALTVTDTANNAATTANVTVKPRTISNVVTVTPSASQSAACGTAVCSGGDAEVKVVLVQNGIPLVGRPVRFDVISGDFRLITSDAGQPESLATSATTTSDSTGTARMRIRVLSDAGAQTGLLQVVDLSTGFSQRAAISIAPSSNAPLNAQPSTIVFQGTTAGTCASGISADVIVFGGRPPYLISQPGSFLVSPTVVPNSGGRFTVAASGQCSSGSQIAVVDSNGATVSVTATNTLSSLPVPEPAPTTANFTVNPSTVDLTSCSDVANVFLSGGTGSYFASSTNTALAAATTNNLGTIQRRPGSPPPSSSTFTVNFTDGKVVRPVTVNLGPGATGPC